MKEESKEQHNNKDKNTTLTNAHIGVDDIASIFADIDQRILSLHECSTKDFLGLNDHFKRFHKDALTIQDNAQKIFNHFTEGQELTSSIATYESFLIKTQSYFKSLIHYIDTLQGALGNIFNTLELMYIPTHNYNQNMMTLKVLLTKLNLNLTHTKRPLTAEIKKELKELFRTIKEDYVRYLRQVNTQKESVAYSRNRLSTIRKNILPEFSSIQENIKRSKVILEQKSSDAQDQFPELESINKANTQNIANIITNLQYHDIIRQKIEHVQKVHQEILSDLQVLDKKENGEEVIENKILLKIKDIAGIQSSQMLHANKEYQKAIHVITSKMIELGKNMNNMALTGEKFIDNNSTSDENQFHQIKRYLNDFNHNYPNNLEVVKEILFLKKNLSDDTKSLLQHYKKLHRSTDQIIKLILSFTQHNKQENEETIEEQTVALMYDIAANKDQLTNLIKNLNDSTAQLDLDFNNPEEDILGFHSIYEQNNVLLANLEESINDILIYVNLNTQLASDNEKAIEGAVSKIQYYDFFEKTAKLIIEKLKEIHIALQAKEEGLDASHIDHLKEKYTMKSEHMIHEHMLQGNGDEIDLFDSDDDEDDDNLELF